MGFVKRQNERQMDEEWSSIGEKYVCCQCFVDVNDYALTDFITANATAHECSYCDNTSETPIAAEMDEVISFISKGIHQEYEDPVHGVGYCTGEGGYDIEPTSSYELLVELGFGDCPEALFDDLHSAFSDYQWVQKDPYGDLPCDAMRYSWEEFSEQVKHKTRFVFYKLKTRHKWERSAEPYTILESLGGIVNDLDLVKELPAGTEVYRARQHSSDKKFTTAKQLGTAPKEHASQSRMSPAGIPMFYGALDETTAFAEIFVEDETYKTASFGKFKTLRPLRLLDLSNLPAIPSLFDDDCAWKRMPLIFMWNFVEDVTKTITKDGMEHIDYVPTQIVAEYFRHVFKQADESHLDGILYRSSREKGGICVALFCVNDDCTDNPAETDKLLALHESKQETVDSLKNFLSAAVEARIATAIAQQELKID